MNLRREFKVIKMKDSETIRELSDRLSKVVTQIRLLGEELSDQWVVEKILLCFPERFKSKISSLEENKDFAHISLAKLVNDLQASEHRRSLRMEEKVEETSERTFVARAKGKQQTSSSGGRKQHSETIEICKYGENKEKYPPCSYCKKKKTIIKIIVDLGQELNVGPTIRLIMLRKFAKIEQVIKNKNSKDKEPKLLSTSSNLRRRNIYLLPLAL